MLGKIKCGKKICNIYNQNRSSAHTNSKFQIIKSVETEIAKIPSNDGLPSSNDEVINNILPTQRIMPVLLNNNDRVVLPFDEVPGPKILKYLANFSQYFSDFGTQLTAGVLSFGLNAGFLFGSLLMISSIDVNTLENKGSHIYEKKPTRSHSMLFDKYGPVVRFVSPVGRDVVLINQPDHINKVYAAEGDHPVRSALDCLEKYRTERRSHAYGGIYSIQGPEWVRRRAMLDMPLHDAITQQAQGICESCDRFTQKLYNMRNYQDEVTKDLEKELNKWAFDSMGLIVFSKKFAMLDTELIFSQCDSSWLYHSLVKASEAISRCESGLRLWKLFTTPAWYSLVKYCDNLDNLIGKHVLEVEQSIAICNEDNKLKDTNLLIGAMLLGEENMTVEDIATLLMDMLLIGVNTITSAVSFLLYFIAKQKRVQRLLYQEVENITPELNVDKVDALKLKTPYLQACIKETLRLAPPIPLLTRVLPKNIVLDSYNIPRGTLIMMSIQDAALKDSNFDDAAKFYPERWLSDDLNIRQDFASISFGYGPRRCLGQNIAEVMLTLLTIKILQKYKLEYHYGDIMPTRTFIARPNKPLKIRFIDRI